MGMRDIFLKGLRREGAPPLIQTIMPSGLASGIMTLTKKEGGAHDSIYQTIHNQTTFFND